VYTAPTYKDRLHQLKEVIDKSFDKCKIQFMQYIIIISVGTSWMKTKCVLPLLEKKTIIMGILIPVMGILVQEMGMLVPAIGIFVQEMRMLVPEVGMFVPAMGTLVPVMDILVPAIRI
jgi:hypothetical protein